VLSDDWASVLCGRLLAAAGAETTSEVGEKNVDIVIDGGRSAVDPYGLLTECPGLTWVSITPFGRTGPWAAHPGSGDAAAASAGLVAWDDGTGEPVPCGDAVAEPITGVHAAVAAYASWLGGGGRLVDIALREVAVTALELGADGLSRQGVPVAEPYAD
jgi:crotonobetainyl-CoA:carnitine CoA-transferase CaiB-like acyl-CoA transferase